MSIKGSSNKLKIEFVLPIFVLFTTLATALRTYQCLTMIDPETGFYKVENISILYLYGMMTVAGILIFAISYLAKKVPQSVLPEGKSIPLAVASFVMAASLLIYIAFSAVNGYLNSMGDSAHMASNAKSLAAYLMKSGLGPAVLEGIFAIFCVVYFIIFAVKYLGASVKISNRKILAVCPVFWATMRMVQRFTRTISFIFVSDLLLELFAIAFMMMFFLSFAQLASKVNSRHVMNKIYAYGLIGAMLSCVVTVPRIIAFAVDPALLVKTDPIEVCDIGFLIFAATLCFTLIKMPKDDNITLKEVERLRKERKDEENED